MSPTLRHLARRPGFAVAAVLSIALGIGVNTTIFSVANGLLYRAPAVPRPDELVRIYVNRHSPFSYENYRALKELKGVFSHVIAEETRVVAYSDGGEAARANLGVVSGDYFAALGIRPLHGRFMHRDTDDTPAAVPEIVLSHTFWTRRYTADPLVVGRTIRLNERAFVVAGVAPEGFTTAQVLWAPDAYMPLSETFALLGRGPEMFSGGLYLTGRLRDGVSLEQADAAVKVLFAQRAAADPEANARQSWRVGEARGITAEMRDTVGMASLFLLVIAALVLLVACSNVGNLLLARNAGRRRELAVRMALGASRSRIVTYLLVECGVIAVLSAVVALVATVWTGNLIAGLVPADAGMRLITTPDAKVLVFTLALVTCTVLVAALAPALSSSRVDLTVGLKDSSAGSGVRRSRLRRAFLGVQVAVSTVLLACAGLFLRSLQSTQRIDAGFETAAIVNARIEPGAVRDSTAARAFLEQLEQRLAALPNVASVTVASVAPLTGESQETTIFREGDAPLANDSPRRSTYFSTVGPGYFTTMGIPVVRGREFGRTDGPGTPPVAVVNQTFAERMWPGESAIGKRVSFAGPSGPWLEVVGVARNIRYNSLGESPPTFLYMTYPQNAQSRGMVAHLRMRQGMSTAGVASAVQSIVRSLDATVPPPSVRPLEDEQRVVLLPARLGAAVTGAFGGLALLLAGVGIFGVAAFAVAQRTREIGIRSALGARHSAIMRTVLGETASTVAVGGAVGLLLALGAARLLAGQLYGVSAADPVTFLTTPLVLVFAAVAATFIPARRAVRVDPVVALRTD